LQSVKNLLQLYGIRTATLAVVLLFLLGTNLKLRFAVYSNSFDNYDVNFDGNFGYINKHPLLDYCNTCSFFIFQQNV